MKTGLTFIATCFISCAIGQTTLTLQPGAEEGKDAYLPSRLPTEAFNDHPDFLATAWTHSGSPSNVRSLIEFDLSDLPDGAIVESATLFLYGYSSVNNIGHASLGGGVENQAYLQRITSAWSEETVTWDTQPSTTEVNQIELEGTLDENLDYEIDVKTLLEDIIANPGEGFGFMFRLVNEVTYNSLLFASSDNPHPALHPKLVIFYNIDTQTNLPADDEIALSIYPNPAQSVLNIDLSKVETGTTVTVYSSLGSIVYSTSINQKHADIDVSNWTNGVYYLRLSTGEAVLNRKIIIN